MNKIFITVTLLISGFGFSQVTIFDSSEDFQSAYSGELMLEDFSGALDEPMICGTVVSAGVENDCFEPGELIEGFAIMASNESEIVMLPAGFLPSENQTPRLGANAGVEKTMLSFDPDVYAVGMSLHIDNNDNFSFRAYDQNDVLLYESELSFSPFVGIVSDQPIAKIELENVNISGELLGDLQFGTQETMAVTDLQSASLAYYPNPVQNTLHISSKDEISHISVYDLTGKLILSKNSFDNKNYTIEMNNFPKGNYLVKVKLPKGYQSFQVIKN